MKQIFFLFVSALVISCSGGGGSTGLVGGMAGISGLIEGANNLSVFFDHVNLLTNTNEAVGKAETDNKGGFSIPFTDNLEAGIYRVRFGRRSAFLVLNDFTKNVSVTGNLNDIPNLQYSVEGSPESDRFVSTLGQLRTRKLDVGSFIKAVNTESDPYTAYAMALMGLNDPTHVSTHQTVLKKMAAAYPNNEVTQQYGSYVGQMQQLLAQRQATERIQVGKPAPEIKLPGPDGKERSLSELKGKVVLLDFWASWCGPCRKANPHVVQTYNKYKDQGFTVASVSLDGLDERTKRRYSPDQLPSQLDRQKDRWLRAIEQDQLKWDWHVSDLKKWDSNAASEYGVRSIPKTFLIDREGNIASIDPRYTLEQELLKYL